MYDTLRCHTTKRGDQMHLLDDKWIPVLRKSGTAHIAPFEIADVDNPVLALNSARPDFNGALAQFLIGLLQTSFHDLTEKVWDSLYNNPPSQQVLQNRFEKLHAAFSFTENAGSFMQDFETLEEEKEKPIASLLIEQPGQQTLDTNTDHFIKRNAIKKMCHSCAVTALFTLQINAPSGGAGHRTSVRGGGPLTTLVTSDNDKSKTLWKMLWLNIIPYDHLPIDDLQQFKNSDFTSQATLQKVFPWLGTTITSTKQGTEIYAHTAHFFQVYWCMPRRIRLNFSGMTAGNCDICGQDHDELFVSYRTKNYGPNYAGQWQHPLTPYRILKVKDKDEKIAMHPQPGGIGYKLWGAITLDNPARVVDFQMRHKSLSKEMKSLKLWAFGYDMDNAKARCWYENLMPFYIVPENVLPELKHAIDKMIAVAAQISKQLYIAIKSTKRAAKTAEQLFWQRTETDFYLSLNSITTSLIDCRKSTSDLSPIFEKWLIALKKNTLKIFDLHTSLTQYEPYQLRTIVIERQQLNQFLRSKYIKKILGIDTEDEDKNDESDSNKGKYINLAPKLALRSKAGTESETQTL